MTENYGEVAVKVLNSLLAEGQVEQEDIVVVGCSSSEVMGGHIGKFSNVETGEMIAKALYEETQARGIYLGSAEQFSKA